MSNDFNFCRMVNKKVVDTESVNDINVNNNDPLDINSKKSYILNIITIIFGLCFVIFFVLFCINLVRYINNINNYMFIFLILSVLSLCSTIFALYFYIKSRK